MTDADIDVTVWGDFALFTRPEFKVERVSYPVITPSAARGMLEAIFWKPEFCYRVQEIGVIEPGTQMSLLRNELSDRQGRTPIFIEDKRQQRTSLILKNVRYRIKAAVTLQPHAKDPIPKYTSQFERRLERGQCFSRPYLGTREFAANFAPPSKDDKPDRTFNLKVGTMLLDLAFVADTKRPEMAFAVHGSSGADENKGYAEALYFDAEVKEGVMKVPQEKYDELARLERGNA
ncbi:type I-C CRISPR-associated protein Cas5c [soil metagenome]